MPKETKPKGTRNRVAPVTPAARDTRKREVSEKVGKATAEVKKRRSEVAARKRKLDDLHESYSDSSKPEEKAEYENLEAEVTKQDAELMEWEAELGKLEKEQKDLEGDTIMDPNETKEDDGVDELFVASSSNDTTQPPQFDLTGPNGKSNPLIVGDSDDEEAVFTPAQAREATGQSHDGQIVAWRQQDRSKPVIVRYGPQNAAKYERSTAAKEGNDFDEEETEEFAKWHAARHQEWQNGQREAKDRSPTPDPNSRLSPTPESKQPEVKIEGGSNGSSLTATNRSAESKSAKRAAMLQYREQWCDLKGIDPENMDPTAEGRFLKAWNEIKDTL
ncbi:uncharacterized protein RSE6_15139 [Rhynchosporium secalis]|uniref:Uncharacterized protein n=1 Tax=Rhynchosporium secalis TaxID=38038 RepID=A0A1E1MWS8_RHYSE|nr:uncharacterized protein RSE6_15139 [Rhynchosporium secalis]